MALCVSLLFKSFQLRSYLNQPQLATGVRHSVGAGMTLRSPVASLEILNCIDLFAKCFYARRDAGVIYQRSLRDRRKWKSPGCSSRGVCSLSVKR